MYAIDRLVGIYSPIKYTNIIRINIAGDIYDISKYEREGYVCVLVWVDAYSHSAFLLRVENGHIWWGNFYVESEKVSTEIDGVKYYGEKTKPTVWTPITNISSATELDLVRIINKLLEE